MFTNRVYRGYIYGAVQVTKDNGGKLVSAFPGSVKVSSWHDPLQYGLLGPTMPRPAFVGDWLLRLNDERYWLEPNSLWSDKPGVVEILNSYNFWMLTSRVEEVAL